MDKSNISEEAYTKLLSAISKIVKERGFKATTMDSLAQTLSISKRTLYEIFESKDEMMTEVLTYINKEHNRMLMYFINSSENMMEAAIKIYTYETEAMTSVSQKFFSDLDSCCKSLRPARKISEEKLIKKIADFFLKGVEQGVFRNDINFEICIRMMQLQMESLKRMEILLAPNISLAEIYSQVITIFLRGIASEKGLDILKSHQGNLLKQLSVSNSSD